MTAQQQSVFEAPIAHEGGTYEQAGAGFEAESPSAHESAGQEMPEAWEGESPEGFLPFIGNALQALGIGETGYESAPEAWEFSPESGEGSYKGSYESEFSHEAWEMPGTGEFSPESWEQPESDQFFGPLKALRRLVHRVLPMGRLIAPMVQRALGSAGPIGGLLGNILGEAEGATAALEDRLFGGAAAETAGEQAYEAALAEVLAAEAVTAPTEGEAEACLAASLPITIVVSGARTAVRPVVPALIQGRRRMIRVMYGQGREGRQLLRAVPSIDRLALAILRRLRRTGRPITSRTALAALAAAARTVLGDPRRLGRAMERNAVVRLRSAPPVPGTQIFQPRRPGAGGYQPAGGHRRPVRLR